jgi:hypothetical protein
VIVAAKAERQQVEKPDSPLSSAHSIVGSRTTLRSSSPIASDATKPIVPDGRSSMAISMSPTACALLRAEESAFQASMWPFPGGLVSCCGYMWRSHPAGEAK